MYARVLSGANWKGEKIEIHTDKIQRRAPVVSFPRKATNWNYNEWD